VIEKSFFDYSKIVSKMRDFFAKNLAGWKIFTNFASPKSGLE